MRHGHPDHWAPGCSLCGPQRTKPREFKVLIAKDGSGRMSQFPRDYDKMTDSLKSLFDIALVREVTGQQERWRKGLELIAMNYDGTQTLSGTQCADIAREALGYDPEGNNE